MYRIASNYLDQWKSREKGRKPLVLRGARQVGKTHLIESWGKVNFSNVLSLNLEREKDWDKLIIANDTKEFIRQLSLVKSQEITPGKTLLFLDELQANESAFLFLRYLYEDLPDLHVVAAGSLLDFVLAKHEASLPVGRVEFLYLNPLSFSEFVRAVHSEELALEIEHYSLKKKIGVALHTTLLKLLREFYFIGGMPEAASTYQETKDLIAVQRIQSSILITAQDDFLKYGTRLNPEIIRKVFQHAAQFPSKRSKYSEISREYRSDQIKLAITLLERARVIHRVSQSAANGVPIAAEENRERFKTLFLDIGLSNRSCNLGLAEDLNALTTVREGSLAEQFIGQELLNTFLQFEEPKLHYWERNEKNSNAEVDFLFQSEEQIIPIEVKAGHGQRLGSIKQFALDKGSKYAVRFYIEEPKEGAIKIDNTAIKLLNLPLYLASQTGRLIREWLETTPKIESMN